MTPPGISLKKMAERAGIPESEARRYLSEFAGFLLVRYDEIPDQILPETQERLEALRAAITGPGFARVREICENGVLISRYQKMVARFFGPAASDQSAPPLQRLGISGTPFGVLTTAYAVLEQYVPAHSLPTQMREVRLLGRQIVKLQRALRKLFREERAVIGRAEVAVNLRYDQEGFTLPGKIHVYPKNPDPGLQLPETDIDFITWTDEAFVRGLTVVQTRSSGMVKAFARAEAFDPDRPDTEHVLEEYVLIDEYPFEFYVKSSSAAMWRVRVERFDTADQSVLFKVQRS